MIPKGIVTTAWPRVEAKLAEMSVRFDRWQAGTAAIILGKRKDGSFAATVGGIVLSIPRQVGKTFLVGMIIVALCLLFPGLTVVWTAHRTRTATKTFHTLKAMTSRGKIAAHMLNPRTANGEQEIRFRNGSVIMFGAREQGFGRGFDQVDIAVFDEAQILTEKGVEDIVPATNQATLEGGALLFFMGTPPRPGDPGEEFINRRTLALAGKTEDMVYVEFSADKDAALDDPKQWSKANPSFPSRTPLASMKRMRANLTDDDSFRREALGIWSDAAETSGITDEMWRAAAEPGSQIVGTPFIAVDTSPSRWTAVAIAGRRADGLLHVEVPFFAQGTDWVVGRVAEVMARWGIETVSLDPAGPVGALLPAFEAEGVPTVVLSGRQMAQACGAFFNAVADRQMRHLGGDEWLNLAVAGAARRPLGDAWAWARRTSTVDIAPLVAATVALHAASLPPTEVDVSLSVW